MADRGKFVMEFSASQDNTSPLEGNMTSASSSQSAEVQSISVPGQYPSTIDEPVKDTIMRDVKAVGVKFYHVFVPRSSNILLKDWDLWGPLILCTILALILQSHTSGGSGVHDGGPQFAQVFCIYWAGSAVVTLNARLVGHRHVAFLQSVCVLGYCVLPLVLALLVCRLALLASAGGAPLAIFLLRCLAVAAGLAWSVFASAAFLRERGVARTPSTGTDIATPVSGSNREALVLYPVGLFYTVIGWMILSDGG